MLRGIIAVIVGVKLLSNFETQAEICGVKDEYLPCEMKPKSNIWEVPNFLDRDSMKLAPKFKRSGDLLNTLRGLEEVFPPNVVVSPGKRNNGLRPSAERLQSLQFIRPNNDCTFRCDSLKKLLSGDSAEKKPSAVFQEDNVFALG